MGSGFSRIRCRTIPGARCRIPNPTKAGSHESTPYPTKHAPSDETTPDHMNARTIESTPDPPEERHQHTMGRGVRASDLTNVGPGLYAPAEPTARGSTVDRANLPRLCPTGRVRFTVAQQQAWPSSQSWPRASVQAAARGVEQRAGISIAQVACPGRAPARVRECPANSPARGAELSRAPTVQARVVSVCR